MKGKRVKTRVLCRRGSKRVGMRTVKRRGGKIVCDGINGSNKFQTRATEHQAIVVEMIRKYKRNENHDFSEDVKGLRDKYCEKFLEELKQFIDDVYEKYKHPPKPFLKNFRNALDRTSVINENLKI